jgi:hypothetical protein
MMSEMGIFQQLAKSIFLARAGTRIHNSTRMIAVQGQAESLNARQRWKVFTLTVIRDLF